MSSLRRIATVTWKEILVLFTRPLERRLIIIPPVVLMIILSAAATKEVKNVDMAILDRDRGFWSEAVRLEFEGSPTFRSVRFVENREEAHRLLDLQDVLFVLSFPDDFSRSLEAEQDAPLQLILDGRRANAAQIAQTYVQRILERVMEQTPAFSHVAALRPFPVRVETVNWFNPNLEFTWFYLPAMIGLLSMMMGFVITGLSVAREKELGTFDQMLVSPAQPTEIAIAKLIPGSMVAELHGTISMLGAHFIYKVPLEGSLLLFYAGLFLFAISVSGLGLMISSLVNTQQQAFLGCFTVAVPFILLSGFASPVDNMPMFLQKLSEADPLRHFLVLIQGVFLKDVSWSGAAVSLVKMTVIAVLTTSVAIGMFRKRV